jgi:uncharacterized repeat protein (TIGR01451 family)
MIIRPCAENAGLMKHAAWIALAALLLPVAVRAAAHVELIESVATIETRAAALVAAPLRGPAKPGQRLRYTIVAKNNGDRPAAKLVPLQHIPAGERFLSAAPAAAAEYSVDAGKTFAREPMVRVTTAAGTTTRLALPAEYTAVRWSVPAALAPGASMTFTFDVVVE